MNSAKRSGRGRRLHRIVTFPAAAATLLCLLCSAAGISRAADQSATPAGSNSASAKVEVSAAAAPASSSAADAAHATDPAPGSEGGTIDLSSPRSKVLTEAIESPSLPTSGFAGKASALSPLPNSDFIPIADRYRIGFPYWSRYPRGTPGEYPYQTGDWYNPYNQNVFKGDYPVIGEHTFLIFTGLSDSVTEFRRLPTLSKVPAGAFVGGDQTAVVQNFVTALDLIHGDTVFKPADWEFKFTPVFNLHYFDSAKFEAKADVNHHFTQRDGHVAIQEMFAQYKVADVSSYYDTINVRAGIQGFVSDFRGFVFADNEPGVRLFGSFESNQDQWNLAYFSVLEKDTFTGLNTIFASQDTNIIAANYTRQDFIWPGYFAQLDFVFDNSNPSFQRDDNGNLVRPANVGKIHEHGVNVAYFGWTGDGHIGPININHAFYEAYGRDSFNEIAGHSVTVDARMGALELSKDEDWVRYRASFLYFTGDANPKDRRATGWDAPLDNPNFAGDGFSFWGREGVPFPGTGVNFKNRFSLIPALKPSNQPGQAQPNFVNPGLFLYNAAMDLKLTPRLTVTPNVNYMRVERTGVLKLLFKQAPTISHDVGLDWGLALKYKPLLIDNVVFTTAFAAFSPFGAFHNIYRGQTLFMGFTAVDFVF